MYGDVSKLTKQLGITPRYNLYEGLKETISHSSSAELVKASDIGDVESKIIQKLK